MIQTGKRRPAAMGELEREEQGAKSWQRGAGTGKAAKIGEEANSLGARSLGKRGDLCKGMIRLFLPARVAPPLQLLWQGETLRRAIPPERSRCGAWIGSEKVIPIFFF
jgi:hypothetical protein